MKKNKKSRYEANVSLIGYNVRITVDVDKKGRKTRVTEPFINKVSPYLRGLPLSPDFVATSTIAKDYGISTGLMLRQLQRANLVEYYTDGDYYEESLFSHNKKFVKWNLDSFLSSKRKSTGSLLEDNKGDNLMWSRQAREYIYNVFTKSGIIPLCEE